MTGGASAGGSAPPRGPRRAQRQARQLPPPRRRARRRPRRHRIRFWARTSRPPPSGPPAQPARPPPPDRLRPSIDGRGGSLDLPAGRAAPGRPVAAIATLLGVALDKGELVRRRQAAPLLRRQLQLAVDRIGHLVQSSPSTTVTGPRLRLRSEAGSPRRPRRPARAGRQPARPVRATQGGPSPRHRVEPLQRQHVVLARMADQRHRAGKHRQEIETQMNQVMRAGTANTT